MRMNQSCHVCLEDDGHAADCPTLDPALQDGADHVHVMPVFPGEREHTPSVLCWCHPRRDGQEPRVVIHERVAEA